MHILVTGGAGFIGSHVCKTLDVARLRAVLEKYQPAALMHFAAFINVGESVKEPLLYHRNNTVGTATLLQALLDVKPLPFVFSSTAAVYGMPETIPIPEDHPLRPINPYGLSKRAVEQMLADAGASHRLPGLRCATSTPPAPTLMAKSANSTTRKHT